MKVFYDLEDFPSLKHPCSMALGNFDGLHLGHQKILKKVKETSSPQGAGVVISFINHPRELFFPEKQIKKLITLEQKIYLLQTLYPEFFLLLLTFTPLIASMSYREFIEKLHAKIPFDYWIFGKGFAIGKNREGDEKNIQECAREIPFEALSLTSYEKEGKIVSSSEIREQVLKGNLSLVETLLGRKYSLFIPAFIEPEITISHYLFEVHLYFTDLVLPPDGIYKVGIESKEKTLFKTLVKIENASVLLFTFDDSLFFLPGPFNIIFLSRLPLEMAEEQITKKQIEELIRE